MLICYNGSQDSGKHFAYIYWFIIQDANRQPDEVVHRERSKRILSAGLSVPMELGCATLLARGFVYHVETLQTPSFGVFFLEVPLHGHD